MTDVGETLFRSKELLVRHVPTATGNVAVVTFDSYSELGTLDRPGFGEAFFQGLGVPAFHILSRHNHWYQQADLDDALAALRSHLAGYRRVIAYGSSMGGYGALTFGGAIGAHVGLALSPQFSVDPKVAPFERRWRADIAGIHFRKTDPGPCLPRQYIVFDPADGADARHAALFAARSPTGLIPVRHGGHPVGGFLNETGVLRPLIERLIARDADPALAAEVLAEIRARRHASGQYLTALADRVPWHRLETKLAIAKAAAETHGGNPVYQSAYATLLDRCGRTDEALAMHRIACAHPDPNPAAYWNHMAHHVARGQDAEAERIARAGLRRYPRSPQLRRKLRWLIVRRRLRLDRLMPGFGRAILLGPKLDRRT